MSQDAKFDFAKAISEIEQINQWFQNEDIDLDVGLEKFKRGLDLIKKCRIRLKQVENEFIDIKKEYDVSEKEIGGTEESGKTRKVKKDSESSPANIPF